MGSESRRGAGRCSFHLAPACLLHRQYHSLLRELKDAEHALGDEGGEANLAWLRDVKARLAEADGTEALIEGFGESSGRSQRSV